MQIPQTPEEIKLEQFRVANPVMGSSWHSIDNNLAHTLAYNVETVIGTLFPPYTDKIQNLPADTTTSFFYQRSPGVKFARIDIEYPLVEIAASQSMVWTNLITGSLPVSFVASPSYLDSTALTGSRLLPSSPSSSRTPTRLSEYLDVSALPTSSAVLFTLTTGNAFFRGTNSQCQGISKLMFSEVPLSNTYPNLTASTEIGLSPGSYNHNAPIIDGSATIDKGSARLFDQMHKARRELRKHVAYTFHNDIYRIPRCQVSLANTPENIDWMELCQANKRIGYLRPTNLYGSGSIGLYNLYANYNLNHASNGKLTMYYRVNGDLGSYSSVQLDLAGNSTNFTTASCGVYLPVSGSGEVEYYFQFQHPNVGTTAYFQNITLVENAE